MNDAYEKPQCMQTLNTIFKLQDTRSAPSVQLEHKTLVKWQGEEEDREEKGKLQYLIFSREISTEEKRARKVTGKD